MVKKSSIFESLTHSQLRFLLFDLDTFMAADDKKSLRITLVYGDDDSFRNL